MNRECSLESKDIHTHFVIYLAIYLHSYIGARRRLFYTQPLSDLHRPVMAGEERGSRSHRKQLDLVNDIDDANEEIRRECFEPKQLFYETPLKPGVQSPARSDPTGHRMRSKKENRTMVKTAQGKSVLSSDIRLHLEKVKAQTQQAQEEEQRDLIETDDELARLDKERRVLQAKVRQRKEIQRLQQELEHAPEGRVSTEYQTEERESSWRQSGDSTYSGQEKSTASFSSKHRRKRRPVDDDSEEEGPQRTSKLRPPRPLQAPGRRRPVQKFYQNSLHRLRGTT